MGEATNKRTGGGRRQETEDLSAGMQDVETGGGYRASGGYAEDNAADRDEVRVDDTVVTAGEGARPLGIRGRP